MRLRFHKYFPFVMKFRYYEDKVQEGTEDLNVRIHVLSDSLSPL